jgi:hypothetical protein
LSTKEVIAGSKERLESKIESFKKSELDAILAETAKEEAFLSEKSIEFKT